MKGCLFFLVLIIISALFSCKSNNEVRMDQDKSVCTTMKFDKADSSGEFTGKIAFWDKPSAIVSYRGLWMIDKENDTIIFRVEPSETKNLIEDRLKTGTCITVGYYTEVIMEDDIELNRFFHATRLDYP